MQWFKHDSDANDDAKLIKLRMRYGMEGYGLYFYCLEIITSNISQNNITFELDHDAEVISHKTGIHFEKVQHMMNYMVDLKLFENTNGRITCMKLFNRLDQSMTSSKALRNLLATSKQSHDPIMTQSGKVMQDKTRLDNTRQDKRKSFTPPTVDQVKEYCDQRQNKIIPDDFIDYYQANGWMRGRSKIKDWKACVRTWEKFERDEVKKQKPKSDRDWETLGQEKGINAKPGESMWNYISRIKEGVYGS